MKFGYHASQYNQKFTQQEEQRFAEDFAEITSRMSQLMKAGAKPSDPHVQTEVGKHYE